MEGETRRRVGTSNSTEEDEETLTLVVHDDLDRAGSPDSETTDEESGNCLMKGDTHRKRHHGDPSVQSVTYKKPHWRIRYCSER